MSGKYKDLTVKLETISSLICDILNRNEGNEEGIIIAEKWLTELLDKIKVGKLETLETFVSHNKNEHSRKDGMLILDSSTKIIRNLSFQNQLLNWSNNSSKQNLIDFISDSCKAEFLPWFTKSISQNKNSSIEVLIEIGNANPKLCLLEIDVLTSNLEKNRIIVYYTFNNTYNILDFDFHNIVFNNLPNMDVYLFDKEYRYILAGGKEKEKNNLSNSDFIGKKMFDVFDKKSQRLFYPFYNKALSGEQTEGEVRYENDIYYIVATPVKNNKNRTIAGILVSQNVTKEKLLEETLIQSKEQAQKADKAKSIFLANLSHEIRTPLNSIVGFTEQINKTELTEQQQKFINMIGSSSEHLLYLVNEIVFLFKLGMDKVYIEKTDFAINDLLNEIIDVCQKQAFEKKLKFSFEIDENLPKIIKGDPYRLRQVLMNLLVNAVKYTDKGSIKLSCQVLSETMEKAELLFEVSDTGIGIDKKDIPYIFDVFEQGTKKIERLRGGAGLGLGICKNLVALFNGEIAVESEINKGSTFSVQIPFQKSSRAKLKDKEKEFNVDDNLLSGKKILLADDDEHNLLLAEFILKGWNTNYTLVRDGEEAIDVLNLEKFDSILLDIHMPHKNGVQVIKALRSNNQELNYSTPTLALTANVIKEDINSYLKAGFNDYVTKPFKEVVLYNKLCNILQIDTITPKRNKIKNQKMEKIVPANDFDIGELEKTANGDKQFMNMMIDNFTENSDKLLVAFQSGIEKKDWDEVGEKAHKAIPSFKFFKLNSISASLEKIEDVALREKQFSELPELVDRVMVEVKDAIEQAKAAKK